MSETLLIAPNATIYRSVFVEDLGFAFQVRLDTGDELHALLLQLDSYLHLKGEPLDFGSRVRCVKISSQALVLIVSNTALLCKIVGKRDRSHVRLLQNFYAKRMIDGVEEGPS